ncbi:MAG: CRISPR-associated endonuclease Cas2 [Acidimicrobiales bacterium]
MARRRYLLAYDISEPARLRQTHKTAKRFGYPLQYSLFVCDLDRTELINLRWAVSEVIDHSVDRVAIIDVGGAGKIEFEFLGVRPRIPTGGPTVV